MRLPLIITLLLSSSTAEFLRSSSKYITNSTTTTQGDVLQRRLQGPTAQLSIGTSFPLGLCEGDCDTDADCQNGLVCFQRERNDPVPACLGTWQARTDFCVPSSEEPTMQPSEVPSDVPTMGPSESSVPSWVPSESSIPTFVPTRTPRPSSSAQPSVLPTMSAIPSDAPSDLPSMIPTDTVAPSTTPTDPPTMTPSTSPSMPPSIPPSRVPSSLPSHLPSSLPSSLPSAIPTAEPTPEPTPVPTPLPTLAPTPRPTPVYAGDNFLNNIGNNLPGPYELCEGDCDNNSDCRGQLQCFQRNAGNTEVPGCLGSATGDVDYCVPPRFDILFVNLPPGELFNLCEGECFNDSDCAGTLVCYTRYGTNMVVPGCRGAQNDATSRNVCTLPGYPQAGPPTPAPVVPDNGGVVGLNPSGVSGGSIRSIHLKLYWEQGYDWQEVYYDLNFCMNHNYYVGYNDCWYGLSYGTCRGDQMYISKCRNYDRQLFDIHILDTGSQEAWITPRDENRCFTRVSREIFLQPCDMNNQMQRWVPFNGPWSNYRFEIIPKTRQDICVTNDHHPKTAEVVELKDLQRTRHFNSLTSFWNTY